MHWQKKPLMANTSLLRMIDASDEAQGERKEILLRTALELAEWLKTIPDEIWDGRIALLNYLQVVKRHSANNGGYCSNDLPPILAICYHRRPLSFSYLQIFFTNSQIQIRLKFDKLSLAKELES